MNKHLNKKRCTSFLIAGIFIFAFFVLFNISQAYAATEVKKPTASTDPGGATTTNPANAYDTATAGDTTTFSTTTYGQGGTKITIYYGFASAGQTYTALALKLLYTATAGTNDAYIVDYSTSGATNCSDYGTRTWTSLVSASHAAVTLQTVAKTLSTSQNLTQLCVKYYSTKSGGSDNKAFNIYDIWTEGTYTPGNPVPTTTSISPTSATYGASGFPLTVNGTNFISSSVVNFAGATRTTTYVSANQLTASILISDLTAVGTYNITVFNPTPGGGTSNAQTFTVNKANQATLTAVSTPSSVVYGSIATLSSTGGSGTGAVTFSVGASTGCNITGGTTLNVSNASGTCSVTATKVADSNYNSATSSPITVTLTKANQAALTFTGQTVTYPATFAALSTTGGLGTGAVTYAVTTAGTAGCSIAGTTLSYTSVGTCGVTATKAADSNYNSVSSTEATFTVSLASYTLTYTAGANGSITAPATSPTTHNSGDSVAITASANPTYHFVNWTGDVGTVVDVNAASTTITMNDDYTVTANFATDAVPAAQFSLDGPGEMATGTRIEYTVTRKDQLGNLLTSGATTVYLYGLPADVAKIFYGSESGDDVVTSVDIPDGSSSVQFWYYNEHAGTSTVVVSDNPSGPGGLVIIDASSPVVVIAGLVEKFIFADHGDMSVGTKLKFTITRQDHFNNPVTAGATLVNLSTSSAGENAKFYDFTTGLVVSSVAIDDGQSTVSFWYYDEAPGAYTITVSSDTISNTNSVTVIAGPITATRFVILDPGASQINVPITVTVQAEDANGNVDTTYQSDVTLVTSGDATGAGLVDIVNGTGSLQINDATAETVSLSLSNIEGITLDVNSTAQIIFSELPPVITGGGGGGGGGWVYVPPVGRVTFSGFSYPGASLSIAAITETENVLKQGTANADGSFTITFTGLSAGARAFALLVQDKDGRVAQSKVYDLNLVDENSILEVDNILISPTIGFPRSTVTKGDFIALVGYVAPGNKLSVEVDGQVINADIVAGTDGAYKYLYNTALLDFGSHTIRTRQTTSVGVQSEFSPQKVFFTTNLLVPKTDFNNDGKLNISDWSIFLAHWFSTDSAIRLLDDLNGDGKLDATDFSIFIRTLRK